MKKENYPELGTQVSYLRNDNEGNVFDGVGVVMAIFLDPRNRVMVRVKDGSSDYNVEAITINFDDAVRSSYETMIERVQDMTKEGNDLVKETVKAYNGKVEDLFSSFLGEPMDLDLPDDVKEEIES